MASSLINNAIQVYFDSVLRMEHEGMVAMFEALLLSGLSGFLGCSSAIYEASLVEFFHNASVRDGKVVSTVQGKPVAILEELFAGTFELPLEGLTDLHEVPKDLVLEARSAFSYDGKLLSTSCKNREMTFEFRLLNDILVKSVTVKAGSFDAVTHERFLMMYAIHGGVQIIQEGGDFWKTIPRPVASSQWELLPQRQYDDTLAPISEAFKIILKRWDDILIPTVDVTPKDFTKALAQLRASVNQIQIERVQKRTYCGLFANVRQEVQLQKSALSLEILESRRKLQSQQVALSQDMDSKLKGIQDQQADLSNDLMIDKKFSFKKPPYPIKFWNLDGSYNLSRLLCLKTWIENYNILTSQLSELVDYINRGGDAKKGEGSSSRGLQPPPNDRSRPGSGDSSRGRGSRSEPARKRGGGGSHRRDWRY
ncbi:65-kDa microtubule-associated protein 3-like [Dorcoceras hygrometricum]|uniref:65-kDa microtubule-associated protein 3-like n=1 Tax=Dorcoceras hygrometricum TaxID=472368 RepID=A0A2Z7C7Z0_9LAMI|nr:65-kDa microtubule-associated protein 3-like [Dorcoceras hygrometricum]